VKKTIAAVLVIGLIATVTAGTVRAQMEIIEGNSLLITNVSYFNATVEDIDQSLNGWGLGLTYDRANFDGKATIGITGSFGHTNETVEDFLYSYTTSAAYLTAKYLLKSSRITGYIGGGIGFYYGRASKTDATTRLSEGSFRESGVSLALPVGVYWWLGEKTGLNVNYTLTYGRGDIFKSDLLHFVNLGVVFHFI
jgi:hypothetical protein